MKRLRPYLFLFLSLPVILPAQSASPGDTLGTSPPTGRPWTERRVVATVLSAVIPGSGQSYLGHTEKGAAFTIVFFATSLTAILSENNVVGRNERLGELKLQYDESRSYVISDDIWSRMKETKRILDQEANRRDLYIKIAGAVWLANMVDMVFFTNDKGERTFGSLKIPGASVAFVPDRTNGVNALISFRF